jgi:membrane fusion protein (multidrug efflux system)
MSAKGVPRTALILTTLMVFGFSLAAVAFKLRWRPKSNLPAPVASSASAPELDPVLAAAEDDPGYIGVLVPPEAADLASRQDGKLMEVRVKVGQKVKKNAILALFDTRMLKHELQAAQAQAGAAADQARRRGGTIEVAGQKVAIVAEGDRASAQFEASAAGARVEQLKAALELAEIRAPFDGAVTVVYTGAGNYLKAGTPIVRVIGDGTLRLRFCIPDENVIKPPVKSQVDARLKNGRLLRATVESHSPEIETTSHCIFTDAVVDEMPPDCGELCSQLAARTVRVVPHATAGR